MPKLVAQPEYGTVYQHQGMLLQNLYRHLQGPSSLAVQWKGLFVIVLLCW